MAILPRDLRRDAEELFPDGPVRPGSVPLFGERLLSQFAGRPPDTDDGPTGREAACLRLGVEGVPAPEPGKILLEEYFLPVEHGLDDVARELNHELEYVSVLNARDAAGMTPAEAVAAGGAALDRVLAMIDDCEWRLRRAEAQGQETSMLPDPGELRRRLGIPAGRWPA